jgi:1-pyrroline-5-carboxylate dehydrogenase
MGTCDDFSIFMSAVIDEASFDRCSGYIEAAKADSNCEIIAGGGYDKSKGYFVEPTIIVTKDPKCLTMREEIFGPILTVYVYEDDKMEETIEIMKDTSSKISFVRKFLIVALVYALTGAIYCEQESLVQELTMKLRQTAGNFYINDKVSSR